MDQAGTDCNQLSQGSTAMDEDEASSGSRIVLAPVMDVLGRVQQQLGDILRRQDDICMVLKMQGDDRPRYLPSQPPVLEKIQSNQSFDGWALPGMFEAFEPERCTSPLSPRSISSHTKKRRHRLLNNHVSIPTSRGVSHHAEDETNDHGAVVALEAAMPDPGHIPEPSTPSIVSTGACPGTTMTGTMTTPSISRRKSKSNFEAFRTEDEDKKDLREIFRLSESLAPDEEKQTSCIEHLKGLGDMTKSQFEMFLDSVIGILIVLNAMFIGVSMDATEDQMDAVFIIDLFFSGSFIVELLCKVCMNGFSGQFRGDSRFMNMFDAFLISIDLVQLAMQLAMPAATDNMGSLPSASIFRVVRLFRLVRILRLLRHPVLQTLLIMLHGMAGGLPTLGWALLLFVMTVYVVALMFREFLGREEHYQIYEYFNSVPRAMITTMRCSFGECVTIQGTPIFEHVDAKYGFGFSVFYCLFAFAMSIGMFNVISAIFVQSTLASATALTAKQKKTRLLDEKLWASRVHFIVCRLMESCLLWDPESSGPLSDYVDDVYDLKINTSELDRLGADVEVRTALDDLDVDPEDHQLLADILDVEQTGHVAVIELLQGVKRLRGNPRRSDIVAVDLTCRAIQNNLKDMSELLKAHLDVNNKSKADAAVVT
eukprot:TRINITY_DN22935_c0_g1_i1.p1 TRINITY_DN22935_c0_g1~~TRINITY_DN22935_c0_g1_i1.p1  ORF type:complete len:653 (-),score=101.39 TRINITY_DN22935_c0_g1_i1:131-2089(-)